MTSLISWVGVDSHGISSVYLASDSRISWGNNAVWDYGRKLFASRNHPEILGYCGDVLFPSQILGQIVEQIDSGILFDSEEPHHQKFHKIASIIKQSWVDYPDVSRQGFEVIYCTRQNSGTNANFHVWLLKPTPSNEWYEDELLLPLSSHPSNTNYSQIIRVTGSGTKSVEDWDYRWASSDIGKTSRAVFSAFCDSLKSGQDPRSGGTPQLVGIYRIEPAKLFGIIYKDERYLFGLPVSQVSSYEKVEWRNELFECCNGRTMMPIEGTQRHARPSNIT